MDREAAFLNVPYDKGYEPLFVTLVSTLVFLGQKPHCVGEIAESGSGRLQRIFKLIESCRVSIHDLSRVGQPPRFNMPFELGLACALRLKDSGHEVVVIDEKPYRLDRILSDYKGRDPLIHRRRCSNVITCIYGLYNIPNAPHIEDLQNSATLLRRSAKEIARRYGASIFQPAPYRALVEAATEHAVEQQFIPLV